MASNANGSNRINIPEAKGALDNMKMEIARELGVNLKQGYNCDLTSR
ncbi:MAG: alpha/beta-type small acid-soluble spore protein, partial [Clostridiales bacterium]|nr:alpha/beta-type small acid-soluble spore protein [Clostridiales bacterium]